MGRFDDRVVLVTGAASGIGRAVALRLAAEGGTVACLDLNADAAGETAKAIAAEGGKASAYACDVSDEASVEQVVAATVADLGPCDVVCNIAGIGRFSRTTEMPLADWDRIIGVNLTGTFLMCKATLPHLLERGGNIVNTASSAGVMGQPFSAAYCASKGGVVLLTKALAVEYIERGVRINAIAPGGIQTPLTDSFGFPEGASRRAFAKITSPMGWGQPDEIAGLFAYVASDDGRYMNGSIVSFDGGITA